MKQLHKLLPSFHCRKLNESSGHSLLTAEQMSFHTVCRISGAAPNTKGGMRRGELLSLKWNQVDFQRNIIHLIRTKSGKQRGVPINSVVRDELLTLQSHSRTEFVFANPMTGLAYTDFKKAFTTARQLVGVEDLHFHDPRHTAAMRMAETGAEPSTIKDILGHSDIRMMDRYTHAVELRKRAALERIAGYGKSADIIDLEERRSG